MAETPPPTVCILGLGQMGLVCAPLLLGVNPSSPSETTGPVPPASDPSGGGGSLASSLPPTVRMWGHSLDEAGALAQTRRSRRLEGFELPESVKVCFADADALAGAEVIVSAIPVQFIREAWTRLRPFVPPGAGVVSVAKGLENETLLRPTQIIADVLEDDPDARPRPMAVLSGPTIAAELARGLP
ncbi:Glycerol-3-phosphate dehydrogenase [NAD(P)+], partial [hydrothermal vent metagenome]